MILLATHLFSHWSIPLSAYGEYGEFRVVCGIQIVSEYAEKIYVYMEKTQRDTKLLISHLIII
jgi:hypothetical protein